jgi:flagellar basal body-associated protein FliL
MPSAMAAGENHAAGTVNGPVYMRLKPISFSVIGPTNKIEKEVSVQLDLELEKGKTQEMLEPYRNNITDTVLVTLTGLYEDNNPSGEVAPEDMKASLLDAINTVAGTGMVHAVLLISIGERKHY